MHPQSTTINELQLTWYERGNKGTPIVFVHGNSLSAEIFSEQFADPQLTGQYRLIALDLPGHGKSGHSKNPVKDYALPGFIDHLVQFIEAMDLEQAIFVGHSLGGHILMEAYEQLKKYMLGMVIFGAPPFTLPPDIEKTHHENDAQFLVFQEELTEEEIHQFASACVREGHEDPELLMEAIRHSDPSMRAGLGHSFSKGEIQDETKILEQMEHPLAIFHGKEDQLINGDYFRQLHLPTLWQNQVHIIDQAGHCPQWENPEAFNRLLDGFAGNIVKK